MLAVTDERLTKEAQAMLEKAGHTVLRLPPHPLLSPPIASHPDMLLFFASDVIYCTKSYLSLARDELLKIQKHTQREIRTISKDYGGLYPYDVLLNALPVGNTLFCNRKTIAPELIQKTTYSICHVNQGYTKCAAVPIGETALITGDHGIASIASQLSFQCLHVSENDIRLPGYDHGFIGGCTSFAPYAKLDAVFFCGDLSLLPQAEQIRSFCTERGITPIEIKGHDMTDVGTVFLI